ncbi:hypothetical protein SAMN05518672_1011407 [Chitinophaga sp. CF118]|uniref:hypothetical protein n=1 Tax=Chitinophaga sp. CF118 TaxID=1884367 RepID=UPI0008E9EB28|nr:hypothetical protein [Chitinophaga sp. CF118]SFD27663.1 hypothetical protein SAMN05518672_1011407 [Chitinophaga sp. CF118]
MIKKLLFLLLVVIATAASASAASGKLNKEEGKDKLKEKEGEKPNSCKTANCDSSDKVANKSVRPSRVEEYVWMLPKDQDGDKMYEEELKKGVLDLYKWYLQNESRVNNSETLKTTGKELAFPFKVDAKTLQQYFQFVKNNFPGLSEDDLTDGINSSTPKKQPVANRKKYAPVSTRDDMESQMTLPVNK